LRRGEGAARLFFLRGENGGFGLRRFKVRLRAFEFGVAGLERSRRFVERLTRGEFGFRELRRAVVIGPGEAELGFDAFQLASAFATLASASVICLRIVSIAALRAASSAAAWRTRAA